MPDKVRHTCCNTCIAATLHPNSVMVGRRFAGTSQLGDFCVCLWIYHTAASRVAAHALHISPGSDKPTLARKSSFNDDQHSRGTWVPHTANVMKCVHELELT